MPAAQELLVRSFVAAPAIRRGELFGDHKAVMIFSSFRRPADGIPGN